MENPSTTTGGPLPPELTAKQQRLLTYLEGEIHRRGRTPSLREAAGALCMFVSF
ncbi:MAG: hypothetical protein JJV98_09830 [Desulfosarcina sp.]|nr:hypothetical protein [Desulfobacterales bacterium]